jgi:hypothetical protein
MGTHQGAVTQEHLDYYLDEFTFRFNRRRSANRGKLFYRLAQQVGIVAIFAALLYFGFMKPSDQAYQRCLRTSTAPKVYCR